ncbi:MAG TPA: serine/threonine-protein kinase, partial [Polyangiaceae bacterium]
MGDLRRVPALLLASSPQAGGDPGATPVDTDRGVAAETGVATGPTGSGWDGHEDHAGEGADRYELRDRLGEGGMGEVYLCADLRIGRDIAMKVIRAERNSNPDARSRFVREARVQGQLEHPSIVPVYDLARDENGVAYFTMRRVRGKTLEQVVGALEARDPAAEKEWTRYKLLSSFASVCQAIDFAHARGVLHRDLKPDNVMLGDFGEVYVLDWGLAKVLEVEGLPLSVRGGGRQRTPDPVLDDSARTAFGAVMGTPGYMAPEQAASEGRSIDARADVYALGAILFELLTLKPLHARTTSEEILRSTLHGADARASLAAPSRDIAPELDAVCVKATAVSRDERYPSARALYEAVERFLAGDRDLERRRALATEHARAATLAAERALQGHDDAAAERTRAMREVSRAVALDPQNAEAMRALVRLFTEPPREIPPEARAELDRALLHSQRAAARSATLGYLTWLAFAPFVLWMGVRQIGWGLVCDALFFAAALASFRVTRAAHPTRAADAALAISTLAIIVSRGVIGPFMLLPGIAAVNTVLYVATADRSRRGWAIAAGCLAVLVPFGLEISG